MRIEVDRLVGKINRKCWWHVPPVDPIAYSKRGKFLSSTFAEAEFYGRPLDEPQRVRVARPLVGDNNAVERKLFGRVMSTNDMGLRGRFALDEKMRREALRQNFDSIVVLTSKEYVEFRHKGRLPRSMELNILTPKCFGGAIEAGWNVLRH
jgi:hypothetical protein